MVRRKLSRIQQKAMFAKQNKRTRQFTVQFVKPVDAADRRQIQLSRLVTLGLAFDSGEFKTFNSKQKRDAFATQLKKKKFIVSKGTFVSSDAEEV